MRKKKFKNLTQHETGALLHIRMRDQNGRLVWVDTTLSKVLEHEASKVVLSRKRQTAGEKQLLRNCALMATGMIQAKTLRPEEAVDYTIFRFKRKTKRDLNKLYPLEEFLVSEIADLIDRTSRTVQNHVKAGDLYQKQPHAKISRADLLKFLSTCYPLVTKEFEMNQKQRTSGIKPSFFERRGK